MPPEPALPPEPVPPPLPSPEALDEQPAAMSHSDIATLAEAIPERFRSCVM
jgi:hypothetical protein